jgi:multicomponent Na+:H+ antiporter subunit E
MTQRLAPALVLAAIWAALWGDHRPVTWLVGLAIGFAVVSFTSGHRHGEGHRLRPLAALRLLVTFFGKLVQASAIVAWEVVTPTNRIAEGIVAVPVRDVSDAVTTLVANAISLTPGTLTVEVRRDPTILFVHVLHLRDPDAVRREVADLERLAIRAVGSDRAQAALDEVPGSDVRRPSQAAPAAPTDEGRRS